MYLSILPKIYNKLKSSRRLSQILVLVSFLITFIIARISAENNLISIFVDTAKGPLRIHHLVPGIFLLIISGYVGIAFYNEFKLRNFMAVLFGIGAALTIDEFALWLYLDDVYWQKEGRRSIDLIIIMLSLLTISVILGEAYDHIWRKKSKFKKEDENLIRPQDNKDSPIL